MMGDKQWGTLAPTVRGLVEGARTRHVLTGIRWTICKKLGHCNPDMVAELKINEMALTSSKKSIIAHSIARGAHIDRSHSLNRFIDLNRLVSAL
jgi:hypothetical protein